MIIRLKYEKKGPIRFVGHLDIMRYFQKVMRRAEIPVAYSQGYSPHMLMTFAYPLPAGATSEGEYVDISLSTNEIDAGEILQKINAVCHEGIRMLDITVLPEKSQNAMSAVAANAWKIGFRDPALSGEELERLFPAFLAQEEILVTKETKKKSSTFDIKPFLYEAKVLPEEEKLFFLASAGNTDNIKPTLLSETFLDYAGYGKAPDAMEANARITIHHVETYLRAEGKLMPLIAHVKTPEQNHAG